MKIKVIGDYYEDSYIKVDDIESYLRQALNLCGLGVDEVKSVLFDTENDSITIKFSSTGEKMSFDANDFDDPEWIAYEIKDDSIVYKNFMDKNYGILNKLCDIRINDRAHYDAPIPPFKEDEINVYEFNYNEHEPLRYKSVDMEIRPGNVFYIDWMTQEEIYGGLIGMEEEIERCVSYWAEKLKITKPFKVQVHVHDRNGYDEEDFSFYINR